MTGHYWPFQIPGWLGGPPTGWDIDRIQLHEGRLIPDDWHEPVVDRQLVAGPRLRVERYGLVRYDFSAWAPAHDTATSDFDRKVETVLLRLKVMNVYLFLSHVAHLELENLGTQTGRMTPFDLVEFGGDDPGLGGGPGLMRMPILVHKLDVARSPRPTVSTDVLERSADLLDSALLSDANEVLERLDLLHFGLTMFQQHDYAQSVVAAWTVCEQLVAERWGLYIATRSSEVILTDQSKVKRVSSDRRNKLRSSDFSMSTVLEILELGDEMDHELFRRLQTVRHRRNRWLHQLDRPDSDAASQALLAATALLTEATGLPLRISLGLSISG